MILEVGRGPIGGLRNAQRAGSRHRRNEVGGQGDGEDQSPGGMIDPGFWWRRQDPKLLYRLDSGACQFNRELGAGGRGVGLIPSFGRLNDLPVTESGP